MSAVDATFGGTSRFVIERRIGAGGMGIVYAAHDNERDVRVALKVLPEVAPTALLRFKREFRSIASITHPNLVQLYELHADEQQWFFTMDLVEGVDFLTWVRPDGLDEGRLRDALKQLARGVQAIHAGGRLHRDLKPPNIMVRPDGSVVILDFGLVGELGVRADDHPSGTAPYMAPEQWSDGLLGAACDWYAVGVVLFEALTGHYPFPGSRMEALRAKLGRDAPRPSSTGAAVPDDLDALCQDLLRRDPNDRPASDEILRRLGVAIDREHHRAAIFGDERGPIIGRERQLAQLADAFSAVEAGATVTAHVQGPSGAGKSLLLERFLAGLGADSDVAVLSGRCYEQESVPFKALDSLVDALADHLLALSPADVAPLIPVQAAALARVFPVLQRVPAIADAPGAGARMADPRETRRAGVAALRELITRLGQRCHVVLTIDDLQWGDQDSATVLAELMAPPDPPRLLLALSYRSEYVDRSACLATLLQSEIVAEPWQRRIDVQVEPLTQDDGEALARALLAGSPGVTDVDYARIARDSGGNPYFVHELARHVGHAHAIVSTGDRSLELDEILWNRVQSLPPNARELLSIVSVAGQRIALRHVLDASADASDHPQALAQLRAEHFIRRSGPTLDDDVETWHDRVRETVASRLSAQTIRTLHAALATTLVAAEHSDAETIAQHFDGAGDGESAARYYARGASESAAALAFDRAARLYRLALRWEGHTAAARGALSRELGRALANAGRGFDAAQAYETAIKSMSESERFELEALAAQQYCVSGHVTAGRAIFRRVLDRAGIPMPSNQTLAVATVLGRRMQLRLRGLKFVERNEADVSPETLRLIDLTWAITSSLSVTEPITVAGIQTKGLLLALGAGEPRRLARALAYEAFLTSTAGVTTIDRAAALMERAESLASRLGDPHVTSVLMLMKGLVAYCQARVPEARELMLSAEEMLRTRCTGVSWEIATARTILIFLHWHLADCVGMRRATASYLADARDRGDLYLVTGLRAMAATWLHLVDDDTDAAQRELADAMKGYPHDGFDLQRAHEMFSTANIRLYEGRGAQALEWVLAWWPAARRSLQMSTQLVLVNFTDVRARALLAAAEQRSDRASLLKRAERDARTLLRQATPLSRPMAHSLLAGIASLRGDRDRAVAELKTSMKLADAGAEGYRGIVSRYRLGRLLSGDEGAPYRAQADAMIAREKIRNPDRLAAMIIPGFPV